jgi:hypothetical protein
MKGWRGRFKRLRSGRRWVDTLERVRRTIPKVLVLEMTRRACRAMRQELLSVIRALMLAPRALTMILLLGRCRVALPHPC